MESWRKVWREGISPQLSTRSLRSLLAALLNDDPRLLQGKTTEPPPLGCLESLPVEGCCPLGFLAWADFQELLQLTATVGDIEAAFARTCSECDRRLGEPAAVRWFLNFVDETPRDEMRLLLMAEIDRALAERDGVAA